MSDWYSEPEEDRELIELGVKVLIYAFRAAAVVLSSGVILGIAGVLS